MKPTRLGILLFTAAFIASNGAYAVNEAGLSGEFLNFGVGARPLGMGRAFTAVADDVDSLYWNPAGLSTYRSSQVAFQHAPLPLEGSFQYLAYSQPLYALGNLGVGIVSLSSNDVPRVDANNIEVGNFDHRETAYMASYANKFRDEKLNLGFTLKMAEKSVAGRSESGFGADVGTLYLMNERVRFGAMLRNVLQPKYDYASDKEKFPVVARTGASVKFLNQHLTTALDLEKTIGTSQNPKWHLGVEGFVIENISLRAGLDQTEITGGMGLRWHSFQFDYGAGYQEVGLVNRFSMKVLFGGYEVDVKADPRVFSPVGLKNKVTFKIYTAHRERIVKWIMTIRNAKDDVVQSYQGYDAPPQMLEWDGRNTQGRIVEEGRYTYRMFITDRRGQTEKTPNRSIRIVSPTPFEIEAK